jgi:hypothetical protein
MSDIEQVLIHYLRHTPDTRGKVLLNSDEWTERVFLLSRDQAAVVDAAIEQIAGMLEGENKLGRALELMAADYLANGYRGS